MVAEGRSVTLRGGSPTVPRPRGALRRQASRRGTHALRSRGSWVNALAPGARLVVAAATRVLDAPPGDEPTSPCARRPRAPLDLHLAAPPASRSRSCLTDANHEASAIASAWNLGVEPDDRWLCCLPLFHVGGLAILHPLGDLRHDRRAARRLRRRRACATSSSRARSRWSRSWRRCCAGCATRAARVAARCARALVGGGPVPRDLLEWADRTRLPAAPDLRDDRDRLAGRHRADRPLPGVELEIGARRRDPRARPDGVARRGRRRTAGCTPATAAASTATALSTWRAGSTT